MNVLYFTAYLMLIYMLGAVALALASGFPGGYLLLHALIFIISVIFSGKHLRWKAGIVAAFGAVIALMLYGVPDAMKANMLIQELMFISGCLYLKRKTSDMVSFLRIKKVPVRWFPLLLAESALLICIASFVNACSMIFFKNTTTDYLKVAAAHFPAAVVILCIVPAVTEEMLFRGGILRGIHSEGKGILISAVLFALWHLNPNQISYAFVVGLLLAVMAIRTDNLLCSVIVHSAFNLYNLLTVFSSPYPVLAGLLEYTEAAGRFLFPALLSKEGLLIERNFFQGLTVSIIAAVIYFIILKIMNDRRRTDSQSV